jgi:hypothetical protein
VCCQLRIKPNLTEGVKEIAAAVFHTGQFNPWPQEPSWPWVRHLPEEGTHVLAKLEGDHVVINLRPGIHSMLDHRTRRLAGAVAFEIAWRFAEKVNGELWQVATVSGCRVSEADSTLYLARFPEERFQWENVCPGFKAVILGEGDPAI